MESREREMIAAIFEDKLLYGVSLEKYVLDSGGATGFPLNGLELIARQLNSYEEKINR